MAHVVALCYHAVSPTWPSELAVTPDDLERQVRALLRRGYRPATFRQAITAPPGPRVVAVTFDDGYRSMRELAYPVLSRLGVPATVFMPTDFIGSDEPMSWPGVDSWRETPHADEMLPMGWDDLRFLMHRGWEIGSHTCSHPHLPTTRDDQVRIELVRSREILEAGLERPCLSVAYPYGGVSPRVHRAAEEAGYECGAALWHPLTEYEWLTWPRVAVYRDDDPLRYALKVSVRLRQLRGRIGRSAGRSAYSQLGS